MAYHEKKQELASKEKMLLQYLDSSGGKIKKITLWSLGAGLIALIGWGIYNSFLPEKKKKAKRNKPKNKPPQDTPIIESILENAAPRLGNWILKEFKD